MIATRFVLTLTSFQKDNTTPHQVPNKADDDGVTMKTLSHLAMFTSVLLTFACLASAQSYLVRNLGSFGGELSGATAINDLGQVAGYSAVVSGGHNHAFLWTMSGGLRDLGTLAGDFDSEATGLNNSGTVVGDSSDSSTSRAFVWTEAGGMQDLGNLGGTSAYATAVNNSGQVAGFSFMSTGAQHAFLWSDATGMRDLGTLGGSFSMACGVNDSGEVVGYSTLSDERTNHLFRWTETTGMQDVQIAVPGSLGAPCALNNSGAIAGNTYIGYGDEAAFILLPNNKYLGLGNLGGGLTTVPYGIGPSGEIVGYSAAQTPNGTAFLAFLWTQRGKMQDLNKLVPRSSGVELTQANAVNKTGQIAATGSIPGCVRCPILLTPNTKP
jgi:probable HAF family extracellular repeat protein